MAKATIKTKSGTEVLIEGSPSEVAEIIAYIKKRDEIHAWKLMELGKTEVQKKGKQNYTATSLILQMREEGFFDEPKELIDVKRTLDAKGALFPVTTLSPILLGLVRKGYLKRTSEGKNWRYLKGGV